MPDNTTTKEKNAVGPRPAAATADLSRVMERSMDGLPDERIRVVWVFGDCYRCNWWVRDKTPHPFWLATGTIRKSRLLRAVRAVRAGDGLLIENVTQST